MTINLKNPYTWMCYIICRVLTTKRCLLRSITKRSVDNTKRWKQWKCTISDKSPKILPMCVLERHHLDLFFIPAWRKNILMFSSLQYLSISFWLSEIEYNKWWTSCRCAVYVIRIWEASSLKPAGNYDRQSRQNQNLHEKGWFFF
jgi:hypothetical protein